MSFQALRLVMASPAATAGEQSVLLVLAWHAGREPIRGAYEAWPSVATIATEAGLKHPATARRVLRRLEQSGRIVRVPSSGRHTNRYRIPTRKAPELSVEGTDVPLHAKSREPCTPDVAELTGTRAYTSSSDLGTRAREANGEHDEGNDGMADLNDEARQRVRDAITVLADRALENEPDEYRNLLAARAGQLVHLKNLTALAARHPQLTPYQLATFVDAAIAIGGDFDSAHDGPDDG